MSSVAMRSAETVAAMRPVFEDLMVTFAEHRLALGRFHGSSETLFIKQHSPVKEIIPPVYADVPVGIFRRRTEPRVVKMQQVVDRPRESYINVLGGDITSQLANPVTREHTEAALDALAVMSADFASLEQAEIRTAAKVQGSADLLLGAIDQLALGKAEKAPILANLKSTMERATQLTTTTPLYHKNRFRDPVTMKQVNDVVSTSVASSLRGDFDAHLASGPFTVRRADPTRNDYNHLPTAYSDQIHPRIEDQLGVFDELTTTLDGLALQIAGAGARTDLAQAAVQKLASRAELRSASNVDGRAMLSTAVNEIHAAGSATPFRASVEKAAEIAAKSEAASEVDALSGVESIINSQADEASQTSAFLNAAKIALDGN